MTERELIEPILDVANAAQTMIRTIDEHRQTVNTNRSIDVNEFTAPLRKAIDDMRTFYTDLAVQSYITERTKS